MIIVVLLLRNEVDHVINFTADFPLSEKHGL